MVADRHVLDLVADSPDDTGGVGASDVEVFGGPATLAGADHIDRCAEGGPDVVVVHTSRHHPDQHLAWPPLWGVNLLDLKCLAGRTKTLGTDQRGMHLRRHVAKWRRVAEGVDFPLIGHRLFLLSHRNHWRILAERGPYVRSRDGSAA